MPPYRSPNADARYSLALGHYYYYLAASTMLSPLMYSLLAKTLEVIAPLDDSSDTEPAMNESGPSIATDIERPGGDASARRPPPRVNSLDSRFSVLELGSFTTTSSMDSSLDSEEQSSSGGERVSAMMIPRGTADAKAPKGPSQSTFAISIPALEEFLTAALGADNDALRTSFDQSQSRNDIASELSELKTILERRMKTSIDPEQKFPLLEDNEADGWELEAVQTSLTREIGTRGSESETLQRIIVLLQRVSAHVLADRDATIQQLASDKRELASTLEKVNKELEDSNAEHTREINSWKVKYYEAVSNHQKDTEAAMKEILRLNSSLKDFAERAADSGETSVGSEIAETPNRKVYNWLGKHRRPYDMDIDKLDTPLKRPRLGSESTRGRSKVRRFGKRFMESLSRARTPEANNEGGGEGMHVAEDGAADSSPTKGTHLSSEDDVDVSFAPRLLQTTDNKTHHAMGSVSASSSTGSSNNADDENTLAGTPTSARNVNGHEFGFLNFSTGPPGLITNVGTLYESSLSRELPLYRGSPTPIDSPTSIISPTPVGGSRKSSPFSISSRPTHRHAASDSPIRAMGGALQPVLRAASASLSNKQKVVNEEAWKEPPSPPIDSWYAPEDDDHRPTKKTKPEHPGAG